MYKHKRYGGIRRILSPLYFGYEKAPTEFFSISALIIMIFAFFTNFFPIVLLLVFIGNISVLNSSVFHAINRAYMLIH